MIISYRQIFSKILNEEDIQKYVILLGEHDKTQNI